MTSLPLPYADRDLVAAMRRALEERADAERAPQMQRYMKSEMPYHGVPSPAVKASCREVFAEHPLADYSAWRDTVLAMFRDASHREAWYCAVALAEYRKYRAHARRRESLALYEELVTGSAWWDVVDTVASHLLGPLHAEHPGWMAEQMRAWATDADIWKRRSAILSQLARKDEADLALLYDCIAPNMDDREFFIRKAIGWALRQVAWRDPDEVVRYVEAHRERLSPLSKREALKNVLKSGRIAAIP